MRNTVKAHAAIVMAVLALACFASPPIERLPIAVLGNSDSHSYHDSVLLAAPALRGGAYRPVTYQWTEIWMRLRSHEVDLGAWGTWGARLRVARLSAALGIDPRAPRKQDYEFNFAVSGARCPHLVDDGFPQAAALLRLMNRAPEHWARGLVIVRIGINSIGQNAQLDDYAAHGLTAQAREGVERCVSAITRATELIRARHPTVRVVLVGIADDQNVPENAGRWRDATANANIRKVLDLFDGQLRALADRDSLALFLDERAWFRREWGGRTPEGLPDYHPVSLGGAMPVTHSTGDHPRHLALADGHAGTVVNGLWLRNLVDAINAQWRLGLTPITRDEIARLADPQGQWAIGPAVSH